MIKISRDSIYIPLRFIFRPSLDHGNNSLSAGKKTSAVPIHKKQQTVKK